MECEAAFKTSFRKDTSLKFTPQALLDDLAFNLQNVIPSDDFSVDDLLDFSHEDALLQQQQEEEQQQRIDASVSVSPQQPDQSRDFSRLITSFSAKDEFVSSELTFPADDEADLEWLSHFVEDSFLEYSAAAYPAATSTENNPKSEKMREPETSVSTQPCFRAPVPAKARSKRTRTGVRVWPLGSPSFAESSSSPSSSSSSSPLSGSWLIYATQNLEQVSSPAAKKPKKKQASEASGSCGVPAPARRCSHCGVQKTPQWRTGPLGAKTLCNACGVRYKSGRLLPEYRPACSPTFSSELHSNHHRKVLEMRREKEVMGGIGTGLDPSPAVPSFD